MLPGLIAREDREQRYFNLVLLGATASIAGFGLSLWLFQGYAEILTPVIVAVPMIPVFRRRMHEHSTDKQYFQHETKTYAALFTGEALAFFGFRLMLPNHFTLQKQVSGITGKFFAVNDTMIQVFAHNLEVYSIVLLLSMVAGSVGAIVISWNASLIGVVFGEIMQESIFKALTYLPHTSLEMGGYITAAVVGTLSSKAAKQDLKHLDWKTIGGYAVLGVFLIGFGALVEHI